MSASHSARSTMQMLGQSQGFISGTNELVGGSVRFACTCQQLQNEASTPVLGSESQSVVLLSSEFSAPCHDQAMQEFGETSLSPKALQQGYRWSAQAVGIDEEQELNLSLQSHLAPNTHNFQSLAEVWNSSCPSNPYASLDLRRAVHEFLMPQLTDCRE